MDCTVPAQDRSHSVMLGNTNGYLRVDITPEIKPANSPTVRPVSRVAMSNMFPGRSVVHRELCRTGSTTVQCPVFIGNV